MVFLDPSRVKWCSRVHLKERESLTFYELLIDRVARLLFDAQRAIAIDRLRLNGDVEKWPTDNAPKLKVKYVEMRKA